MKKLYKIILFLLIIGIIPLRSQAAEKLPKPTDALYVNDFADVIDEKVEEEIIEYGNQLNEKNGTQVVLVTVDFTNGVSLEDYAHKLFNKWGIGSKEKNNGLLILLSVGDDDYWAMQGEGLEESLTSGKISGILNEYLEPDFAAKDYSAGAEKVYGAFIQELGGQWLLETAEVEDEETKDASLEAAIQYTYDKAGILSKKAEAYINDKSNKINQLYGAGVYVATKDYCDEGLSFQEDAFNTFSDINAGSKDVLLVLYKEDDNYWVLPGEEAEVFATDEVLQDILDNTLEPQFAEKMYSQGAMNTADRFYELLQANIELRNNKDNNALKGDNESSNKQRNTQSDEKSGENNWMVYLFLLIISLLFARGRRRKRFRRRYGVPFNPYSRRYIRHYGPEGYWGHQGRPPVDYDNWEPEPIRRNGFFSGGSSSGAGHGGAGRSSSGGSSWGSSSGAGRSSSSRGSSSGSGRSSSSWGSSSGAGRSSSSGGSRSSSSSSSFGGGSSRGGGAGRSSGSSSSRVSSGSSSSGAGRSTGGGGSSRGGGAGRKK